MTIKAIIASVPVVLSGWIATLAGVAVTSDKAPAYLVLLPSQNLLMDLPHDAEILATSRISVTLTSDETGFVRELYQDGAWLVLPAGLAGCFVAPSKF